MYFVRHFSGKILQFNKTARLTLIEIIRNEIRLPVKRTRFKFKNYLYPISVQSFIDDQNLKSKTIGRFNCNTYTIELNYTYCIDLPEDDFINLLKHELAHYLAYLEYGNTIEPHGEEFRKICKKYNWGQEISSATIEMKEPIDNKAFKMRSKYKKLIGLSKSDNIHEASLALEKANELMLTTHFIDHEQEYFVTELCQFKRKNSKIDSIYHIMQEMNFGLIFHYGNHSHSLETFGSIELINQSMEIYKFLNDSLDQIWLKQKKESNLKGIVAKNSFFYGFSKGVLSTLQLKKKNFTEDQKHALIKLEQLVNSASKMIYGRLSKIGSSGKANLQAESLGFKSGQSFNPNFIKHKYLT